MQGEGTWAVFGLNIAGVCCSKLKCLSLTPQSPGPGQKEPLILFRLFQDALLSLGAVIDIAGLRQAARDALSAVLPKVVSCLPFLLPRALRLCPALSSP